MAGSDFTPEERAFFDTAGASGGTPPEEPRTPPQTAQDAPRGEDRSDVRQEDGNAPADAGDGRGGDDDANGQGQPQGDKRGVPDAQFALRREKDRRKAAEERARQMEERFNAFLDVQRAQMQPQVQPQQPAEPEFADPDTDPMQALRETFEWRKQQQEADRQQQESYRQETERRQFAQRVQQDYDHAMRDLAPEHVEEVKLGTGFLRYSRFNELVAQGYDQRTAAGQVQAEELEIAHRALSQRVHPATLIMQIAQARGFGYWQAQQQAAQAGAGSPPAQSADQARLATAAEGQRANASIGSSGRGANARGGKLDAKAIAEMPMAELEKLLSSDPKGESWRRAMGG